ncbi:MAG: hypothetical protein ACR2QB_06580 [Gammaproteobacteria bacterium]
MLTFLKALSGLSVIAALSATATIAVASEQVSTMQPFAKGDVFVAATVMDDPKDDHRGTGRVLQFDSDFKPKGVLWIEETTHKIGGLTFAPDGTLWGFAQIGWQVIEIGANGKLKPLRSFGTRSFSNINWAADGSFYMGEHLVGSSRKISFNTTEFAYMPFTTRIGDGHIFHYSPDGRVLAEYENEVHGGVAGIHGTTNAVLSQDGKRMAYISETGNRVMHYDLAADKQLPDLAVYSPDTGGPPMVLFMMGMPDGRLLVATGASLLIVDPDSGATLNELALGSSGWAALSPSIDAGQILLGNFFTGEFIRLRLDNGEVLARGTINEQKSLSGIAQYVGRR